MDFIKLVRLRSFLRTKGYWEPPTEATVARLAEAVGEVVSAIIAPADPADPAPDPADAGGRRSGAVNTVTALGYRYVGNGLWEAPPAPPPMPIDMILYCPSCGHQHVDGPERLGPTAQDPLAQGPAWDNPPHRTHHCHHCHHQWRPADVPTNGVAEIKTKGKSDSELVLPMLRP